MNGISFNTTKRKAKKVKVTFKEYLGLWEKVKTQKFKECPICKDKLVRCNYCLTTKFRKVYHFETCDKWEDNLHFCSKDCAKKYFVDEMLEWEGKVYKEGYDE